MIAEEDDGGGGELTAGSLRALNRRSEELERLLVRLGVKFQTARYGVTVYTVYTVYTRVYGVYGVRCPVSAVRCPLYPRHRHPAVRAAAPGASCGGSTCV
jgi:hypothetical protein